MDAHVAATSATVASAGIGIAAFWASVRGVNAPPMVDASAPRANRREGEDEKMRAQRLSVAARAVRPSVGRASAGRRSARAETARSRRLRVPDGKPSIDRPPPSARLGDVSNRSGQPAS